MGKAPSLEYLIAWVNKEDSRHRGFLKDRVCLDKGEQICSARNATFRKEYHWLVSFPHFTKKRKLVTAEKF